MHHSEYPDDRFVTAFADLSFPPAAFSHEAHLRLAFVLISSEGVEDAAERLCVLIRAFAEHHGNGSKFNHTVTVAAAHIVNQFMQRRPKANFQELLGQFPRLSGDFIGLLRSHYGFDPFQKPEARHRYLEPDLLPF